MNRKIETENYVPKNEKKKLKQKLGNIKIKQNIGMSVDIVVIDTAQKIKGNYWKEKLK